MRMFVVVASFENMFHTELLTKTCVYECSLLLLVSKACFRSELPNHSFLESSERWLFDSISFWFRFMFFLNVCHIKNIVHKRFLQKKLSEKCCLLFLVKKTLFSKEIQIHYFEISITDPVYDVFCIIFITVHFFLNVCCI